MADKICAALMTSGETQELLMLTLLPCSQPRDVYPLTKFNSFFNSCTFDYNKIQIQTETRSLALNHQVLLKRRTFESF